MDIPHLPRLGVTGHGAQGLVTNESKESRAYKSKETLKQSAVTAVTAVTNLAPVTNENWGQYAKTSSHSLYGSAPARTGSGGGWAGGAVYGGGLRSRLI